MEAAEKDYWEIPEALQSPSCRLPPCSPSQSMCSVDNIPDHPPLPVPRTLEKQSKTLITKGSSPMIVVVVEDEDEGECPISSPPHAVLAWGNKAPVCPIDANTPNGQELSAMEPSRSEAEQCPDGHQPAIPSPTKQHELSLLDPAKGDPRQRPVSSFDARQHAVPSPSKGMQQRPVSTSGLLGVGKQHPVPNGTQPSRNSNMEMCRTFFPSNDDMNVTCPMITNPVRSQEQICSPVSPGEECSPLLEKKETTC